MICVSTNIPNTQDLWSVVNLRTTFQNLLMEFSKQEWNYCNLKQPIRALVLKLFFVDSNYFCRFLFENECEQPWRLREATWITHKYNNINEIRD